jgi:RNA polymerase sigma-70 factor (ECF subfamily)
VAEQLASFDSLLAQEALTLQEDEECLLQGLREGTEPAYETLIERYQQPVYNLVVRLMRDPGDACDVVQEVFLKVFRRIGSFRGDSKLRTWIYRIAVNEAHNHCRWNGRHRGQEVGLEGSDEARSYRDTLPAHGDSPYDYVLDREKHHLVEAALAGLNPTYRSVVVLRDIEDLSYEEIAEILQLPLGTVKSRILRGRDTLRKELERLLEPEPGLQLSPQLVE